MVLEAYPNEKPVQKPEQDALILLSAKSEDSLKNMVGRYADFLEQHSTPLENIAWELEMVGEPIAIVQHLQAIVAN